ncbi:MAG: DUF4876 domain-containing protein [Paludibacteraceae bacterium]|nr:DUF4876 domain-containing protein [Paludibacteraceae bacterium]
MKKNFRFLALAGVMSLSLGFTACEDDEEKTESTIKSTLNISPDVADAISAKDIKALAGAKVTFTNVNSKDVYSFDVPELGADGSLSLDVNVPVGTYDISMEKDVDGKIIFLRQQNVTIKSENQQIEAKIIATVANSSDYQFIFSELFFNGERNGGRMMHPDQFMVLYNPTDKVLYADGLAVGNTMQASCREKESWYDEFYGKGLVPVDGFIVIPGSGYDVPVKPHDKIVIAFTAINHTATEGKNPIVKRDTTFAADGSVENIKVDTLGWDGYTYENAIDLSGADYEIYDPQLYTSDVDNPKVPNVREIYPAQNEVNGGGGGFYQHPRGYYNAFIFKLKNGNQETLDEFFAEHSSTATVQDKENNNVEIQMLSVPASMILDGIATSDIPSDIVTNALPQTVDRGKQLVKGCHSGLLVKRKGNDKDGYADTNDSSVDCEILSPHKDYVSYPEGWRK